MLHEYFEEFLVKLQQEDIKSRLQIANALLEYNIFIVSLESAAEYDNLNKMIFYCSGTEPLHHSCYVRYGRLDSSSYFKVSIRGSSTQVPTNLVPDEYSENLYRSALLRACTDGIDEFTLLMNNIKL